MSTDEPNTQTTTNTHTTPAHSPWQTQSVFDDFARVCAPVKYQHTLGKNITHNQADVEVLAMILKDIPLSTEKFDEMRTGPQGQRDWVGMPFTVLQVGPAGFSSVPYTANKKGEGKGKMVYEVDDLGRTRFHPFEKGKTNKDKGVRVSEFQSDDIPDTMVDATSILEHGVMLSTFLRGDNFTKTSDERFPKMFMLDSSYDAVDVLPAYSLVYLQMSSSNIEQAKKGQGVKVRKIKGVGPGVSHVNSCFASLPQGEGQLGLLMERAANIRAISKMVYQGSLKTFAVPVSTDAFAVSDVGGAFYVICEASEEVPDIRFSEKQLLRLLNPGCSVDTTRALKFINVALAVGALNVVVALDTNPVKQLQGDLNFEVASMQVDVNKLLHLHTIACFHTWPCSHNKEATYTCTDDLLLKTHADETGTVMWCDPTYYYTTPRNERMKIIFKLDMTKREEVGTGNEIDTSHFLSYAADGHCHQLTIYIAPDCDFDKVKNGVLVSSTPITSLQVRPENRTASVIKKRRRFDLAM